MWWGRGARWRDRLPGKVDPYCFAKLHSRVIKSYALCNLVLRQRNCQSRNTRIQPLIHHLHCIGPTDNINKVIWLVRTGASLGNVTPVRSFITDAALKSPPAPRPLYCLQSAAPFFTHTASIRHFITEMSPASFAGYRPISHLPHPHPIFSRPVYFTV